jgi:hypothetical protein
MIDLPLGSLNHRLQHIAGRLHRPGTSLLQVPQGMDERDVGAHAERSLQLGNIG